MTFITSIADHVPSVQADAEVSKVDQAFQTAPHALAFAVCVDRRVVGVIEREAIAKAMLAGFADSAVGALMLSDPLIVDASTPAQDVCRELLTDRELRRDAYVVTQDGAYLAVGLLSELVERLLNDHAERVRGIDQAVSAVNEAELIADAMSEHKRKCVELLGQEFRTPLSGVAAMAEMLQRQPMGADALAQVGSIRASAEALLRLLNDSMDLTKAEEGLLDLYPEPVLLRGVADRLQELLGAPGPAGGREPAGVLRRRSGRAGHDRPRAPVTDIRQSDRQRAELHPLGRRGSQSEGSPRR